jgi:hypothetical protein
VKRQTRRAEIEAWVAEMLAADDDECWPWPFATYTSPQSPQYTIGMWRDTTATRVILTMKLGPPPDPAMHACHEVDCELRPLCCNPNHLYWGTVQNNIDDQGDCGTRSRGEKQWASKITEAQAMEIIRATGTSEEIAHRFGVKKGTVAQVKNGKTWAHLDRSELVRLGAHRGKVTEEMARAIIPDPRPQHIIAAEHGISPSRVSGIKTGLVFPHLDRSDLVVNQRGGPKSDLDDEKVLAIIADPRPYKDIAAEYGVGERAIHLIKNGGTWKHVDRSGLVKHAPGGGRRRSTGPNAFTNQIDSEETAIAILADLRAVRVVAAEYGVSRKAVSDLRAGVTWTHLERPAAPPRNWKVTEEIARAIIVDPRPQAEIAEAYGLSHLTVHLIKKGRVLPHLDRSDVAINKPGRPSVLTETEALAIVTDPRTYVEVAAEFGVTADMVRHIKKGRRWKDIDRSGLVDNPGKRASGNPGGRRPRQFTDEEGLAIIPDPRPYGVIARDFGCSAAMIREIKLGIRLPHLDRSNVVLSPRGRPGSAAA